MRVGRVIRQSLFWGIPILASILLLLSGFVYWLIGTPTGTRWALNTVALQFDGESRGVDGSLWHGFSVEHLALQLPDALFVELDSARVRVDWMQLWHSRRLLVNELSAQRVVVAMDGEPTESDPNAAPFAMPQLPVSVQIDRLALGQVEFSQQGESLPVDLSQLDLVASGVLNNEGAQLSLQSVRVGYDDIWVDLEGLAQLQQLAAPWQSQLELTAQAAAVNDQSIMCLSQYLPSHLQKHTSQAEAIAACGLDAKLHWEGSLDQAAVTAQIRGQGVNADLTTNLQLSQPFPLRDTYLQLSLPDNSTLAAELFWQRDPTDASIDHVVGNIKANHFDVGAWLPDTGLASVVTLAGDYSVDVSQNMTQVDAVNINLHIDESSRWNAQPLRGHAIVDVVLGAESTATEHWQSYIINNSDIDIQIGDNQLVVEGAFGLAEHVLKLKANAPSIATLWPGLSDIGATEAEITLQGDLFEHQLRAALQHDLIGTDPEAQVGNGLVVASLGLNGVWDPNIQHPSWQGQVQSIQVEHVGLGAAISQPFSLNVQIPSSEQVFSLDVGAFTLQAILDKNPWLKIHNINTQINDKGIRTKGNTDAISLSAQRVNTLLHRFGIEEEQRGGIIDNRAQQKVDDLSLQLDWDVSLTDALAGTIRLKRVSGDILIPASPPFPLDLVRSEVVVTATPNQGGRSTLRLDAAVETKKMGYVKATGSSPIYYSKDQGFELRDADPKEVVVDAHMDNLAWTNIFLKDQFELGGELIANVKVTSTPAGGFETQGDIRGNHLRITRLDDGVRLLDGELKANITHNRFTIERLYFPAQLRVEPKEWRTATWISENPDAKDGYLLIKGFWDINDSVGDITIDLHRYPLLQRADRYAMVSGQLQMLATLPEIVLNGKITADAGWFNLDMLGGIPTVDSDVVVIRSTDAPKEETEPSVPLDLKVNLTVDLGPRFYLTGYGVNSGLVGQLTIHMQDGQLTGIGALNTRGGAIEIYGQRLLLRRGTITFQGDLTNPLLDIQALRTGLSVEAGVRVGGTARRPKIDLISVPEVSELEKLSWLLFGHGPDDSSGDLALLLSVGTSLLTDGEPFYRRFGIDELSIRSGELGGAGSILPATSVASSRENEVSDIERQFIEISKKISDKMSVSLRQALSDTGTVGRISYRLARRLNAELSIGTVSGLGLVYRWLSMD